MTQTPHNIPAIPRHFSEHKPWQTALYLGHGVMLYLVPGVLAYLMSQSGQPLGVKIVSIALLTLMAGQGLFMLGVTGHEGFHYTLHRNRFVSAGLGMFFSSAVPTLCALGFAVNHWDHHRFTNTEDDPDVSILLRYRHWLPRLLFARSDANRHYLRLTLKTLFMAPEIKERTLGMTKRQLRQLAAFNLFTQAFWLSVYATAIWLFPEPALYITVLPIVVTIGISGLNHYYEHEGTTTHPFGKARSRTSWVHTALMGGTNYHLEHHLYPTVPCWRLRGLHRWLIEQGHYDGQPTVIEPRYFGSYLTIRNNEAPTATAKA